MTECARCDELERDLEESCGEVVARLHRKLKRQAALLQEQTDHIRHLNYRLKVAEARRKP